MLGSYKAEMPSRQTLMEYAILAKLIMATAWIGLHDWSWGTP